MILNSQTGSSFASVSDRCQTGTLTNSPKRRFGPVQPTRRALGLLDFVGRQTLTRAARMVQ